MERSSTSDSERRYASIMAPMCVVLSWSEEARARQRGQRRGGGAESEGFLTRELHLLDGKACGVQASVQRGGLRAFPRAVEAFDEYERAAAGSGHDGETRS